MHDQNLIPLLLSFLSDKYSASTQTASGDFIKALITISANASQNEQSCIGPNDLTRQLVSHECVTKLISDMLKGGNPLTVGVGIIIEVIRKNNSDYDPEISAGDNNIPNSRDPIYLGTLLRLFAQHVPDFMKLIQSHGANVTGADGTKQVRKELKVAFGGAIEPLGFDRFKTCELMAELLHCSNMKLLNEKGGERYVMERDAERERLKKERRAMMEASIIGGSGDTHSEAGQTEGDMMEGVVVEKPHGQTTTLQVQNGGAEVESDDGIAEEEFEDVTISAVLEEPLMVGGEKEGEGKKEEDEFVDEPLSPVEEKEGLDAPLPTIPVDEVPPLNVRPKGQAPKEVIEKLDEVVKETKTEKPEPTKADDEVAVIDDTPPPPPPPKDQPASTAKAAKTETEATSAAAQPPRAPSPPPPATEEEDDAKIRQEGKSLVEDLKASIPELDKDLPPLPTQGEDEEENLMDLEGDKSFGSEGGFMEYQSMVEPDVDGKPVVGDYLKMMFVEHQVVPTILVSRARLSTD